MSDIIYVLTNEAMPGYIKIGKTTNLPRRIKDLDNTSVPLPFECYFACEVKDMNQVEKMLHQAFSDDRIRSSREFFKTSPHRIKLILKLLSIKDISLKNEHLDTDLTEEDVVALNVAHTKRKRFKFHMANIPIGSEIYFVNDENITAKVIDNGRIEINDRITHLSPAAEELLGYGPVQGTLWWIYQGQTLEERRTEIENEENGD